MKSSLLKSLKTSPQVPRVENQHFSSQAGRKGPGPLDGTLFLKFLHTLADSRISAFTSSTASISGPFMSIIMRVERSVLHPQRIVLCDHSVMHPKRIVLLHVRVLCYGSVLLL